MCPTRAVISVLLLAASLAGASAQIRCLRIEASGFATARGHAVLRLYRPGDDVPRAPALALRASIADGGARFCVDVPPGDYAAVVFHDQNDNGEVDHNVLGLPSEPLGFSGGYRMGLTSGMPSFDKLKFRFTTGMAPVRITVK